MKNNTRKLLSILLALVIVLSTMTSLVYAESDKDISVTISVEGLTLGQGMYVEPVTYTLSEINELVAANGYGPYTEENLTPAVVTIAMFLDKGIEWTNTGDLSSFYLSAVKDFDKGYLNIPSIITENGGPSNDDNDGNDDEYLGEFDYGPMSGWMITVDHYMIHVGAGAYTKSEAEGSGHTFGDGSVIRWQFTLNGYGADLGYDTGWGMGCYYDAANKDALYKKYAELSAKGFFHANPAAKASALSVMENLTANQTETDNALSALIAAENAGGSENVSAIFNEALANLASTVTEPKFGTTAGEWSVLCLARGDYYAKDNKYFADYYDRIVDTVNTTAASVNLNGALHKIKSTENSRLILALSAIGKDARKVGDWNLIEAYSTNGFNWIKKQGINGPVFALIALDTNNYQTTDPTIRQQCIDFLLEKQLADGGWALSGSSADPDMTAMALQALAPYVSDTAIAETCNKGFTALSNIQNEDGGYASWGSVNSESIAQVIVACTAHGINPNTDKRFIKNGNSAIDAILKFYDSNSKMFCHIIGDGGNAMGTDQAIYALAAYQRFLAGKTSLYDMTDAFDNSDAELTAVLGLPEKIGGTANTAFKANISINKWDNEGGYKLIDCIVDVPPELTVTDVTASNSLSGGQLQYNLEENSGKLRIVYFDPQNNASLQVSSSEFPAELFTIGFKVKTSIDPAAVTSIPVSISGMSVKLNSDSFDDDSMIIVNINNAKGNIQIVTGVSYSAVCLYQGDDIDLIPSTKKAVAVSVAELDMNAKLIYNDGTNEIEFLYNAAISEKTGVKCYAAIVDAGIAMANFAKAENYTIDEKNTAKNITFGDVNDDNIINAQDALASVDFWLRKSGQPTNTQILALNVNSDSRINTFDALGIVESFVNGTDFAIVIRAANLAAAAN